MEIQIKDSKIFAPLKDKWLVKYLKTKLKREQNELVSATNQLNYEEDDGNVEI